MTPDKPLRPELKEELVRLNFRLALAQDLGMAILGMPEAFESEHGIIKYHKRLSQEQPDLFRQSARLEGRWLSIFIDGYKSHITD